MRYTPIILLVHKYKYEYEQLSYNNANYRPGRPAHVRRVFGMKEKKIRLRSRQDVAEFVDAAGNCDFEINVGYDRVIIDAKSLLGMLGLGFSRILNVKYKGTNEQFEQALEKYEVACE